jgi:ABC-type transport system involved in multi-copper enzyme maturation permease subunit
MSKVLAIAINTFKEAVRNRVLYVLLFFSVLIMLGAWVASTLSIDEEIKIVRDLGIGAINFISLLIAVFVGIGLVYNDLDKRTIYTIVSKPISRWQFLVGKYFGLLLTIAVNVLVMTWIFAAVLHFRSSLAQEVIFNVAYRADASGQLQYQGSGVLLLHYVVSLVKAIALGLWHILSFGFDGYQATQGLFAASVLTILEMGVITGFAILFSSFSSPTLSAFMTVIIFIIGRLNQDLYLFADTMATRAGGVDNLSGGQMLVYYFSKGSAYITPNLAIFDRRKTISEFQPIDFGVTDFLYGVVYTVLVLTIAVIIFNRRNFK